MPLTETLKSTWSRFFASVAYEKDPGFREVILRLSRRGMLAAGALGIVGVLVFLGLHAATGRVFVLWDYSDPRMLALWDKLLVIGLSLTGLGLSRTQADPRWGRLVVAAILLVISVTSLLDDVASQDISFSAGWLGVFMLMAVGMMPYHPWQAFTFSSAITGAYFLCIRYAPDLLGIGRLEFDTGQSFFIVIISLICTSISWLLYNNRYEQYQALRRAEQLQEQLEKAYTSLEESLQLLTETQDQLVHAEKMASLGRLAAGIAHEMRNPLNFVNNFAEILVELSSELRAGLKAEKGKLVGEVLEDVEALLSDLEENAGRINEHGKRAEGIVRSMIQHARSSSGEREATNLNALLDEHVKQGIGRLEFDTGQSFFIVIISLICTSISWLLYNNRYEQYQALRRAEQLQEQLEKAYTSLEESLQLLTETQDQLVHAEKMASLGRLAAGIAHEMRNPLNFVNNFAEILVELSSELRAGLKAEKGKLVGEVLEDVEALLSDLEENAGRINEHGKRAEGIVRSMIQHARSSSGERQATNLNALLDEHVKLAYHGMRAQQPGFTVTMECNYDDAVGHVELVPQEMGRVFINLLNNAFYAVHERARAGDGSFVARVQVSTRKAGDTVEIRVCDNGPGISEEVKDKVFEPFFTTKPTGSGTGLGLSLSYEIVVQGHHGQMTVESEGGEGATFIVTLPLAGLRHPV